MKKSVFMVMAAAAFVSCSQSELKEPVVNDGSLIALKSVAYSAGASTRVPFEGMIGADNTLTAFVPSSTKTSGTSVDYTDDLHTTGTMTFNSSSAATYDLSSLSESDKSAFPMGDQVYLFGAYPATGWELKATSAEYTFTGLEDVMGAAEVLVKKDDVRSGKYETLAFEHLLTKLEVKFKAEASAVGRAGYVKSVKWVANDDASVNLKNKVTFTPAATGASPSEFAEATTPVTKLSFYKVTEPESGKVYSATAYSAQTHLLTTTATLQAYAMVTPVVANATTKEEYYLEVVREVRGSDVTDYIPFDLMGADNKTPFTGSTAGNSFTVVVNYTKDDVKAVATVADWQENGEYIVEKPVD